MNQQKKLIYLNVDLFLYDLRNGLGQDEEKIKQNRHQFWRKIKPKLDKDYQELNSQEHELLNELSGLEKAEADYVELLIPKEHEKFKHNLEGYCYALQLGDTYALQVDGAIADNAVGKPISYLRPLKEVIESRLHQQKGNIGQTWLVWGQLEKNDREDKEIENTARSCYAELISKFNWDGDLQGHGKFLGATAFELWQTPSNWADEQIFTENFHLIICLFSKEYYDSFTNSISKAYFDLIRLFCYRNKVLWAYHQSRELRTKIKNNFNSVQQKVQEVSKLNHSRLNLSQLQSALIDTSTILSEYTIDLSYLDYQYRTIQVNLENYRKRLAKIEKENSNTQLQFLRQFSNFATEKYVEQVKTDYTNLSPGLSLLENLINTIRGTIDVYQAKSDRNLDHTIAAVGVGLATTEVTSAVLVSQVPPPLPQHKLSPGSVAIWSIAAGTLSFFIIQRFLRHLSY